jgi:endonuclease YncB( thermonuclease family)
MGACLPKRLYKSTPESKVNLDPVQVTEQNNRNSLLGELDPLSLDGDVCMGYCVKVYDGDTCTLNLLTKFGFHKWSVRMSGYDAPELKTHDVEEKTHAIACREMLKELVFGKFVIIHCAGLEKYGRLLGTIMAFSPSHIPSPKNNASTSTPNEIKTESCISVSEYEKDPTKFVNVNEWMIKHTSCVPYDGGKKSKIEYQRVYHPQYIKYVKSNQV